ncbi:aspartate carbamoyltransferase catalytic subunit [bacterium]|nr:aspartate carbamoyltransferase catalytic subunit [bacterium]
MAYRSLISILDLASEDVDKLLDTADSFLPRVTGGGFKDATLEGVSALLLFYEPSTRTRVSFELAGKMLGLSTINAGAKGSSAEKGESLIDTAMTFSAMGFNIAVLRHPAEDAALLFAKHFEHAVINAGSGSGEHPTQALLDAMVLRSAGKLEPGKRIAIVGDIRHSRVARSGLALFSARGMQVTLVAPPSLMPEGWRKKQPAPAGVDWQTDLDAVLPEVDAVIMLRMQRERMAGGYAGATGGYAKLYALGSRRLGLLRDDALILHPGPVNRGVEVSEEVFADKRCRINEQVSCGVAMRCAVLCWAAGRTPQGLDK